ncbi:hypothetical protein [Novosphingobium pentaromativorans]
MIRMHVSLDWLTGFYRQIRIPHAIQSCAKDGEQFGDCCHPEWDETATGA